MSIFKKKENLEEDAFAEEFLGESLNTIEEKLDAALPLVKDLTPEGYARFRGALDNIYAAYHLVRNPEEDDTVPVEITNGVQPDEDEIQDTIDRLEGKK